MKKDTIKILLKIGGTILICAILISIGTYRLKKKDIEPLEEFTMNMVMIRVPIMGYGVIETPIPANLSLESTDGVCTWTFSDGTKITVYDSSEHVGMKQSSNFTWYDETSAQYILDSDTSVVVESDTETIRNVTLAWKQADPCWCGIYPDWEVKWKMKQLPKYNEVIGVTSPKGIILPGSVSAISVNAYSAELWRNESSYVGAYVKYDIDDVVDRLIWAYVTMLSDEYRWYKSDDIIFAYSPVNVMAAKKVTENKWIIYTASIDKLDYVLVNLTKVSDIEDTVTSP